LKVFNKIFKREAPVYSFFDISPTWIFSHYFKSKYVEEIYIYIRDKVLGQKPKGVKNVKKAMTSSSSLYFLPLFSREK